MNENSQKIGRAKVNGARERSRRKSKMIEDVKELIKQRFLSSKKSQRRVRDRSEWKEIVYGERDDMLRL